jgi:small subunit ribosomal protein S16
MGKKKAAFYRIVVTDSRNARDSRAIEEVGTYNPVSQPGVITVREDRVFEWLNEGAQPSDTVASLFQRIGMTEKWNAHKSGKDTAEMVIKTELVETVKPKAREKKAERTKAIATAKVEAEETKKAEAAAKRAEAEEAAKADVKAKAEAKEAAKAEAEAAAAKPDPAEPVKQEEPAKDEETKSEDAAE